MHIALIAAYWTYPEVANEFPILLGKRGHKVSTLLWNSETRSVRKQIVTDRYTIWQLPGINLHPQFVVPRGKYPFFIGLNQLISKIQPNIIDCQSHLFLTTLQAVRAAKKLGIPTMVTIHGFMAERSRQLTLAQLVYIRTVASWIFENTDVIRCLTKADLNEVSKYVRQKGKTTVIQNAVDTEFFKPLKQNSGEQIVLWTGRFVPEKGLEYLVNAAKTVCRKRSDIVFALVGDGPIRQKIKSIIDKAHLSRNFLFSGSLQREDLLKMYQQASIFVLPSVREGMPYSLLEAMSCGKAIVASDIPGINEVIVHGHNGLLVPPRDSEAIAQAILTLVERRDLRIEMGQNARITAIEKYDWRIVLRRLEDVYLKIASNND